ncbi:protein giant-lens isoform X2 [Nasonia vitripennis]|uniref:Protein giant-lens n=1 Tax=Nasonia vitripennis TaxID=7425 RepID=A0A7M7T7M6_NASVI|nr:protein giant-lens isoform X2 [Nasonia vitripennis]
MRLGRTMEVAQLWLLTMALSLTRQVCSASDSLLGMEFDDETGEELLKALVPSTSSLSSGVNVDNSIVADLQLLGDMPDTTIVLIGDQKKETKKEPLVVYQIGSEADLPECQDKAEVCSKVDLYGDPWVERQCRCPSGRTCSRSLHADDGHTIVDKTRQYKLCEPVKRLPVCRYFKDVTWTIAPGAGPRNSTVQKMHCRCRPGSVAYLVKRHHHMLPSGNPAFIYSFACSPQSRMRCQPKEPCRLFTVHKKTNSPLEDVNASPLCQCPKAHRCPRRHTDPGSLPSSYYGDSHGVKIYSGHCVPVRHTNEPVYTLVK